MSRDPLAPLTDPRPGDVVRVGFELIKIWDKGIMHKQAIHKYGIRGGSQFITYTVDRHCGITFHQSLTGFKKRIKNGEVLHVAQD